jgi:hypothetical protein
MTKRRRAVSSEARHRSPRGGRRLVGVALPVVGTGHVPDDGVDVGALALDLVDVEAAPGDAIVADAGDGDAALVERRAVGLGSRPVDLDEDGVTIDR